MLSCKEVSELAVKGEFETLPFLKKMSMMLHMKMCKACQIYKSQIRLLKKCIELYTSKESIQLSDEARERIRENLKRF